MLYMGLAWGLIQLKQMKRNEGENFQDYKKRRAAAKAETTKKLKGGFFFFKGTFKHPQYRKDLHYFFNVKAKATPSQFYNWCKEVVNAPETSTPVKKEAKDFITSYELEQKQKD